MRMTDAKRITEIAKRFSESRGLTAVIRNGDTGETVRLSGSSGQSEPVRLFYTAKETAPQSETERFSYVVFRAGELWEEDWEELLMHAFGIGRILWKEGTLSIREFDGNDAGALEQLAETVRNESGNRSELLREGDRKQAILDYHRMVYSASDVGCFGIFEEERLIGIAGGERVLNGETKGVEYGILLHPEVRGRGIGTRITEMFREHFLWHTDYDFIFARTAETNTAMRAVFSQLGFQEADETLRNRLSDSTPEGFTVYFAGK